MILALLTYSNKKLKKEWFYIIKSILYRLCIQSLPVRDLLEKEMKMLDPSWLSSGVSALYACKLVDVNLQGLPTLDDIVSRLVNVSLYEDGGNGSQTEDRVEAGSSRSGGQSQPPVQAVQDSADTLQQSARKAARKATPPSKTPKKINLKTRNKYGEYQIHQACKKPDMERLRAILKTPGVDVNVGDNSGNTPLHEAVVSGSLEAVKALVEFVPPKTIDKYFTPTKGANSSGGKSLYPNLMAKEHFKETPIHYAVAYSRLDILEFFFEFIEEQERKKSKHFPSLAEVLRVEQGGKTLESCTVDKETLDVIEKYKERAKTSRPTDFEPLSLDSVSSHVFRTMLNFAIERFVRQSFLSLLNQFFLKKSD